MWKSKTRVTDYKLRSDIGVTSSNPRVKRVKARVVRLKVRVRRLKARVETIKPRVKQ